MPFNYLTSIPDGWLDYCAYGDQINNTRFVPFKVPLSRTFDVKLDVEQRFGIYHVLKAFPNIGLIIDLTQTERYYDPNDFLDRGVDYKKVITRGKEVPSPQTFKHFANVVNEFLKSNKYNDALIGVHCTHGINRTGFLICTYLVRYKQWRASEAIYEFEMARHHKIERMNYVDAVYGIDKYYNPDFYDDGVKKSKSINSNKESSSSSKQSDNKKSSKRKISHKMTKSQMDVVGNSTTTLKRKTYLKL